jgi:hypothetical protein
MHILPELTTALYKDLTQWIHELGVCWRVMEEYAHIVVSGPDPDKHVILTPSLTNVRLQFHLPIGVTETTTVTPDDVKDRLLEFFDFLNLNLDSN